MIRALLTWFDDRTGAKKLLHEALYERIPGGSRWRYVWGSTLIFTFTLQVITGIALWTAYSPSTQTAWESVYYIQNQMTMGSIVRGIHHFAAQAMTVLLAIHLIQVIIDGAYKAPREVNFWLGLILMKIILALGLTGYLLPWDQKGMYATKVTTNIMSVTPVVGPEVQTLAQGGTQYNHHTITRFFALHAGVLPGLLIAFLVLHIYVFRRHGITVHDPKHAPETSFWPDQVLKDAVACFGVLAVVLLLAIFKGAELSAPATPGGYEAARPEWYFLFLFRFLKFELVEEMGIPFGAIYVPGLLMLILFMMPILARKSWGHKFNVGFLWTMTAAILGLTGIAIYEDSNNASHQAAIAEADRDAHRVQELASRPSMIPVEGAAKLLMDDPYTQGPRIFEKQCSSCHRSNGHNGRGRLLMQPDPKNEGKSVVSLPEAADLGNFGSEEWARAVVLDYPNHFRHLRNANWHAANVKAEDVWNLENFSEMKDASADYANIMKEGGDEDKADVEALIHAFAVESGRTKPVKEKIARAKNVLSDDYAGNVAACTGCHAWEIGKTFDDLKPADGEDPEYGDGYPVLTGYGSASWLRAFIKNPAHFYGDNNQMPAFHEKKLSAQDRELLLKWMTGDYHETHVEDYPSRLDDIQAAEKAAGIGGPPAPKD
jgi:ubiquinol-cytochrome c reductase cytochrome b subunit